MMCGFPSDPLVLEMLGLSLSGSTILIPHTFDGMCPYRMGQGGRALQYPPTDQALPNQELTQLAACMVEQCPFPHCLTCVDTVAHVRQSSNDRHTG